MADRKQLYAALGSRAGFETVSETATDQQLRVIGRVSQQGMPNWLIVIQQLLLNQEDAPWNVDISKQYFLRGGKVLYGWRLIFQGEELESYLDQIIEIVHGSPHAKRTVDEVPLVGCSPDRNVPKRGKGAQGVLGAVVGPAARNM